MEETPRSGMSRVLEWLYRLLAEQPVLVLLVVAGLQTFFLLDSRALWFSDEIRYANVMEHLVHAKKWLVLYLNGEPYPDKPPVYFWLLWVIYQAVGHLQAPLFFLGAALSGAFYSLAAYLFARKVTGLDKPSSLAAGLVLISVFYFAGVMHYSRMDLLFATFITLCHVCLFRAWQRDRAPKLLLAAGFFAAIATLTKGPLGVAFPLLASLLFLIFTGNIRRLFRRDVLMGLLLCLLLLAAWVGGAYLTEEHSFLQNIFHDQIYKRATKTWHHGQPFWHYAATFPAAWLPWTLIVLVLPWRRLNTKGFWKRVGTGLRDRTSGKAYTWIALVSGFLLLSAVSIKIIIYLMPLFAPLAALCGDFLMRSDDVARKRLYSIMALILGLVSVALPAANYMVPWPIEIQGLIWSGLGLAVLALLVWRVCARSGPGGGVLILALGLAGWLQVLGLMTVPSLDAVMSPRAQGTLMRQYVADGYFPMAYKVYSGTYTYYAGTNVLEVKTYEDVERMLEFKPKVVLGMRKKYFEQWENRPAQLHIVHEQWIVDRPYVLVVQDAPPEPGQQGAAVTEESSAGELPTVSGEAVETEADSAMNNATDEMSVLAPDDAVMPEGPEPEASDMEKPAGETPTGETPTGGTPAIAPGGIDI